jgi:hypothetical protein
MTTPVGPLAASMGVKGDVTIAGEDTVGVDAPAALVASPALTLSSAGEPPAIFTPLQQINYKRKRKRKQYISNNK